jgi:hypothetical protein
MPTEEYCASRDARGTFGPPSFDDAKFEYRGGTKRLVGRMKSAAVPARCRRYRLCVLKVSQSSI